MAKLRFEIEGDPDNVQFHTYWHALADAMSVLRELDSAISGKYHGALKWYVSHLSSNGTLAIDLLAKLRPVKLKKNQPAPVDISADVTRTFVVGFENLEQGTSPPYISEFGLERIKDMLEHLGLNGARGYRATNLDEGRSIAVSNKTKDTVRQLLPADRFALGSVEGTLETISIHNQQKFVVYHALSKRAVTCFWKDANDPDMLKLAFNALGKRVLASGRVEFNAKGDAGRVRAEEIRILGEDQLPTTADLAGSAPGIAGDLTSADYIRSLRE